MSTDLDLLRDAANEAAELALALRAEGLDTQWKDGGSPVTNGDLAVDALLKERLLAARPDYGWLSEETADNPDRLEKRRVFMVDPIDGTTAYARGKPWWTICIGVVEDGRPIAGVVVAPALDEFYDAAEGEGARMNGALIGPSKCGLLEGCAMLGDARMFADPRWPQPWPAMNVEARNSVAYRMCLVAAGVFDGCLAPSPKHDWDLAAADLIVQEAGALATDNGNRRYVYNRPIPKQQGLVCAGPALHPLLLARVAHIQP